MQGAAGTKHGWEKLCCRVCLSTVITAKPSWICSSAANGAPFDKILFPIDWKPRTNINLECNQRYSPESLLCMTTVRFEGKISLCKWKRDNLHTKGFWSEFGPTVSENPCERRGILPPSTAFEICLVPYINTVLLKQTKGKIKWKSQIGVLNDYPQITGCIGFWIKETNFCGSSLKTQSGLLFMTCWSWNSKRLLHKSVLTISEYF